MIGFLKLLGCKTFSKLTVLTESGANEWTGLYGGSGSSESLESDTSQSPLIFNWSAVFKSDYKKEKRTLYVWVNRIFSGHKRLGWKGTRNKEERSRSDSPNDNPNGVILKEKLWKVFRNKLSISDNFYINIKKFSLQFTPFFLYTKHDQHQKHPRNKKKKL